MKSRQEDSQPNLASFDFPPMKENLHYFSSSCLSFHAEPPIYDLKAVWKAVFSTDTVLTAEASTQAAARPSWRFYLVVTCSI